MDLDLHPSSLLRRLASFLPPSLVSIRDHLLSLAFLSCGLLPITVELDSHTTVRLWAPARRRHHAPSLLLIHGFGGNSKWQFHSQIPSLAPHLDLYVPDLLFFGRSLSLSHDRSVAFQARSIARLMRRIGVDRYSVFGISYGGFVAYRLAEEEGEKVDKVVIATAGVAASEEERRSLTDREARDVSDVLLPREPQDLMELMRRSMFRPPRWIPAFLLRDFIQVMYKEHRKERVELLKELIQNGVGMDPLPALTQETLILWGDHDEVFPVHLAHKLRSHLGDKCKLEIVDNAGHACQLENPHQVNYLIKSFLLDSKIKKEI